MPMLNENAQISNSGCELGEIRIKNTYSVIRMEYIWSWRIVDNDDAPQVSAKTVEVFHVIASVEYAAVAEQSRPEYAPSGILTFNILNI